MRFGKLAFVAGIVFAGACGGEKAAEQPAAEPTPAAAPAASAAPITGTTHVVNMVGDASGVYKFEPAAITIKAGDGIRFESVSMGPHNVAFVPAELSAEAKAIISANMPNQDMGELSTKLLNVGENITISFGNVPAGSYTIDCTPHIAMGMKMKVTVQ